jgi:hypothetical protein
VSAKDDSGSDKPSFPWHGDDSDFPGGGGERRGPGPMAGAGPMPGIPVICMPFLFPFPAGMAMGGGGPGMGGPGMGGPGGRGPAGGGGPFPDDMPGFGPGFPPGPGGGKPPKACMDYAPKVREECADDVKKVLEDALPDPVSTVYHKCLL